MATERPDVAAKVKAMIALAPATYVYHMKAPIRLLASFWREFQQLSNLLGINEFFARGHFFNGFAKYICKSVMLRNVLCSNSLFLIAGFDPEQLDYANLKVYNSSEPPEYDISRIQVPIAVFWSDNDWLVGGKDVETFYKQVPLKLGMYKIAHDKFNHFDFLWALDAPDLVYSKILDLMSKCNNRIIDELR
ncbi:lipase 3-like [Nasonia vitripennis]|uniref:Uncharacterized protein n=1 Tax=Nasonia vitripennis TaxID=7425 RepID=A0A7M7QSI5_NASVI|nr:lipase 3-like [Nasonia vitripennis]